NGPSWGRLKARTRPAVGNHEYQTTAAAGYFDYFNGVGVAIGPAGDRTKGYYSYDAGAWHVVVLNSNCNKITNTTNGADCAVGSAQYNWLQNDLTTHPTACTLAYWHHPLFTTGSHYGDADLQYVKPLFQLLYNNNADLVLNGHDHNYQRWAPQDPNGNLDSARGIREFVVGTGGRDLDGFATSSTHVEARDRNTFGVIKLTLHATSYDWQFVPEAGQTWTDSGSTNCH
ncbi:MAG TPA: metallophosphoesterase, partial [Jatrophihabitans sp.]|nr:metallophosphoesterase [Jatrophihabitans sp.]